MSEMQFNGLNNVKSFSNTIISSKCTHRASNAENLVNVEVSGVFCNINKGRRNPEKATEEVIVVHTNILDMKCLL